MPKVADIGAKRLISLAPDQWAQWVTQCPDVTVRSIARSEFEWVSRASDVALRAYKPDVGEFLILNEMQFFYKWHMPFRINAYASLAEEKYRLPVFPVMVVLRPPGAGVVIQDYYEQNFLGLSVRRTYQVIKLWEIEAEPVLAQPIPTLLPFVPLLKGGESEPTVRQALGKLRDDPILHEMETLLAFFATFVLESSLVQQIMRWDMTVLRESPWYREILQEGKELGILAGKELGILAGKELGILEGKELGILEGKEFGILEGKELGIFHGRQSLQRTLLRMLSIRFGDIPYGVERRLQHLDLETLEALADRALTAASLEECVEALPPLRDDES